MPNERATALLARAIELHDAECDCDRRYRKSCPRYANAILRAGQLLREENLRDP